MSEVRTQIPYRSLGTTGERISVIGLGGHHIGVQANEKESIAIIRTAIDNGVNFMDNCWDYHDGASEIRMGKALQDGYRQKAFLMTKIDGRTATSAERQIDESLTRLQTDIIDLLQIHEVIRTDDPDRVFADGGAMEALQKARNAGKFRYLGFTGHKSPDIHLKMLDVAAEHGISFDAVQMPLNIFDAHFDSFEKRVVPRLMDEGVGILGMKPIGGQVLLDSFMVSPEECLRYAMSLPVSVVITGCDSLKILEQALEAARNFTPLNDAERAALLERTAVVASGGEFELYKTTSAFDATSRHSEWLE